MNTVIIYSQKACGKSFHKKELAAAFGCSTIIDGWTPGGEIVPGALHLCNQPLAVVPEGVRQLTFKDACKEAGIVSRM